MSEFYEVATKFFIDGGAFIYPIGAVLAIGILISIERWMFLTLEITRNTKSFKKLLPLLRTTDLDKMQDFTKDNNSSVTKILGFGLDMMSVTKQKADIEHAMGEGMLAIVPKLEERIGYLAVFANVATLLGLLGTIIGLIGAFSAVASADPAEKSRILSQSISVAMNTTAFGLIAAIPLLIIHAVLRNKTQKIVTNIEVAIVKFLNIMTVSRFIETRNLRNENNQTLHTVSAIELRQMHLDKEQQDKKHSVNKKPSKKQSNKAKNTKQIIETPTEKTTERHDTQSPTGTIPSNTLPSDDTIKTEQPPQTPQSKRAETEKAEAERVALGLAAMKKAEEERAEAERAEAERAEAERAEAERAEAERAEAERAEAERAEAERVEAERVEAERVEAERAEAERVEAERAEAERVEAQTSTNNSGPATFTSADPTSDSLQEAIDKLEAMKKEVEEAEAAKLSQSNPDK